MGTGAPGTTETSNESAVAESNATPATGAPLAPTTPPRERSWACATSPDTTAGKSCYSRMGQCERLVGQHNMKPATTSTEQLACVEVPRAFCATACKGEFCIDHCGDTLAACQANRARAVVETPDLVWLGGQFDCAEHAPPPNEFAPLGSGWHCFDFQLGPTASSMCSRHEQGCQATQAVYAAEINVEITRACEFQPEAACWVDVDPLRRNAVFECTSSLDACNKRRRVNAACAIWN